MEALIPTEQNLLALQLKITRVLNNLHATHTLRDRDVESLAQDILIEAWRKQWPVTITFIRHRLINAYHTGKVYTRVLGELRYIRPTITKRGTEDETPDYRERLSEILNTADLSNQEMSIIYQHFFSGLDFKSIAVEKAMNIDKVSAIFNSAISKLRSAGRIIEQNEVTE